MAIPNSRELAALQRHAYPNEKANKEVRKHMAAYARIEAKAKKAKKGHSSEEPTEAEVERALDNLMHSWKKWLNGTAFPEISRLPAIVAGLNLKDEQELTDRLLDLLLGWRMEKQEMTLQMATTPAPEPPLKGDPRGWSAEPVGAYDNHRSGPVTQLVVGQYGPRRRSLAAGRREAADIFWPSLVKDARNLDEKLDVYDQICEKGASSSPAAAPGDPHGGTISPDPTSGKIGP